MNIILATVTTISVRDRSGERGPDHKEVPFT